VNEQVVDVHEDLKKSNRRNLKKRDGWRPANQLLVLSKFLQEEPKKLKLSPRKNSVSKKKINGEEEWTKKCDVVS